MIPNLQKELRLYLKHCHSLKRILKDTDLALNEIYSKLRLIDSCKEDLLSSDTYNELEHKLNRNPCILVFGQNINAKALFINLLLEQMVLPLFSSKWRFVTIRFGYTRNIRLTLGHEYEIVEKLRAHDKPWITVPECDLQRNDHECLVDHCPSVEIEIPHQLLKENTKIMIPPDCHPDHITEIVSKQVDEYMLPLLVYVVSEDVLTESNIMEISRIRELYQFPLLFFIVSDSDLATTKSTNCLTESEQHLIEQNNFQNNSRKLKKIHDQLTSLGYLHGEDRNEEIMEKKSFCSECSMNNTQVVTKKKDFTLFICSVLKSNVMKIAASISDIHNKCLRSFILSVFDMAREIQITPKRIIYAQEIEMKLYRNLMQIGNDQQEEITNIIQKTLQDMKSNVAGVLEEYENGEEHYIQTGKTVNMKLQHLVLNRLRKLVADRIMDSIGCLQESFTGTLQRCLESLEKNCHELEGNLSASNAVKQILTAAYNIDLKSTSSFSMFHMFMDRLRKLLSGLALPWTTANNIQDDLQWKLHIVTNMIDSLNSQKLAKSISSQFQEHVKASHDSFLSAIRSIEVQLSGQLEHTEKQRISIRKRYAPRFAKLALESTSMCDTIRWGMPQQIKEIGRGQYGVVSSCEPWGEINPCAFKSVVPPDDRHWNDLAMEFYYTRTIPEHPRIVKLKGSVIDYSYGGGNSPAVLLIMERMNRDLYCGLKGGLSWVARLQIAIDVVEGIRYLHSQGLIHRDIKLKNVLLDGEDRAKLTDFGFCIPEAMMSGSVVGTPVHMAPELLSGKYDSSVDVYAFGILFWYICANQVRLPSHFDNFENKEQLWRSVKNGKRPEYLSCFSKPCWSMMEKCWAGEPSARPLLGYIQPQLEAIFQEAQTLSESPVDSCSL